LEIYENCFISISYNVANCLLHPDTVYYLHKNILFFFNFSKECHYMSNPSNRLIDHRASYPPSHCLPEKGCTFFFIETKFMSFRKVRLLISRRVTARSLHHCDNFKVSINFFRNSVITEPHSLKGYCHAYG
jgi:hypothetical protein